MKRVSINGDTWAAPFAGLFRPHTPAERTKTLASIQRHGIKSYVLGYISPVHGRALIDGSHRSTYGEELGVDVPILMLGRMFDKTARELAITLNVDRRHLTLEEQQAHRGERITRVVTDRQNGKSTRAIAAEHGVSQTQVLKDLSIEQGCSIETVTGLGGKSYPAKRKRPRPLLVTRANRAAKALAKIVSKVLAGPQSHRLAALAEQHGVPLVSVHWPALEAVGLVLRDLAQPAAAM